MGEPNNALAVYMNRQDRIQSVLEYYLGEKLPMDWKCEEIRGFYSILENEDFFKQISKSAVDVIDVCTNIKDIRESLDFVLNPVTGEEEADMCKALTDIKNHAERQGIKQGMEQGLEQGLAQGLEQGLEQGLAQGLKAGTQRTNKLNQLLLAEGRQEDLLRSIRDSLFQKELFKEYQI